MIFNLKILKKVEYKIFYLFYFIQWKTIKIDLPKWATMSSIVFSQDSVKIEGKLWFFSGSWSAGYKELIHAIDNVMQKWNYTLLVGNEQIGFRLA